MVCDMKIAVIYARTHSTKMSVTSDHINIVRSAASGAEVRFSENQDELIAAGFDADVLVCWATGGLYVCEDYCKFSTKLKWVHALSAGVEGFTITEIAKKPGIRLTNSKGIHGIPISETVIGYILGVTRELPRARENQLKHLWQSFTPDEVFGKTIGILGAGSIGGEIAKRCKAFGMTVLGVRRTAKDTPFFDKVYPVEEMDAVITVSDFVVMLMPSTPETGKIFSKDKISLMKKNARFINVGRGMTVDNDALADALRERRIQGAMLDAFVVEPLPADHPLWDLDNVLISPHMSASTPLYMERAFRSFAQNMSAFLAGEPMPTEIFLQSGKV